MMLYYDALLLSSKVPGPVNLAGCTVVLYTFIHHSHSLCNNFFPQYSKHFNPLLPSIKRTDLQNPPSKPSEFLINLDHQLKHQCKGTFIFLLNM